MPLSKAYLLLAAAIVAEVCATTAMKSSDGLTRPGPTALTVVGYLFAFWCLAQVIRVIPTGIAYAIWSGVGIVLICLLGWIVHGQQLSTTAMLGIALIIAGVVVVNVASLSTSS